MTNTIEINIMINNHSMIYATTEHKCAVVTFSTSIADDDGSAHSSGARRPMIMKTTTISTTTITNNINKDDNNGAKIGLPLSGTKLLKCSSSRDTWVMIEDASI